VEEEQERVCVCCRQTSQPSRKDNALTSELRVAVIVILPRELLGSHTSLMVCLWLNFLFWASLADPSLFGEVGAAVPLEEGGRGEVHGAREGTRSS